MQTLLNTARQEPVLLQGVIQGALAMAVAFGTNLSAGQVGAILALTAAVLSFLTRTQVSPTVNSVRPQPPANATS